MSTLQSPTEVRDATGRPSPWVMGGGLLGLGVLLFLIRKLTGIGRGGVKTKQHSHEALMHSHEHVHVTHERTEPGKGVGGWSHLTASHTHEHNHASLAHAHRPHRNFDAEHGREAHIHDHDHPLSQG